MYATGAYIPDLKQRGKMLMIYDLPSNMTSEIASTGIFPCSPEKRSSMIFSHLLSPMDRKATSPTFISRGLRNISGPQEGGNSPDVINTGFSPEDMRPFPKVRPRKVSNKGEKRRKSVTLIVT
jgi:hypothetical protein